MKLPVTLAPYAGLLLLGALVASHGCAYRVGGSKARADMAEQSAAYDRQLVAAIDAARKTELAKDAAIAAVATVYEQDKTDAKAKHDAVVADLRAGAVRLRDHWTCPVAVPSAAAGTGQRDAAADLRAADSGDLVRLGAEADAQIRAAQAVIVADRK